MSNEDEERAKAKLAEEKKRSLAGMVTATGLLQAAIKESGRARLQRDLKGLQVAPLQKEMEDKEQQINTLRLYQLTYFA